MAHLSALQPVDSTHRTELLGAGLALGCLWYLDALTTAWALQRGALEAGPVAGVLVAHGMGPLLLAKALGLALVIALAWAMMAQGRARLALWGLGAVGALSLGIVLWNLLSILLLAGVA